MTVDELKAILNTMPGTAVVLVDCGDETEPATLVFKAYAIDIEDGIISDFACGVASREYAEIVAKDHGRVVDAVVIS